MQTHDISLDTSFLNTIYDKQIQDEMIASINQSQLIKSKYSIAQIYSAAISRKKDISAFVNCVTNMAQYPTPQCIYAYRICENPSSSTISEGNSQDQYKIGSSLQNQLADNDIDDFIIAVCLWSTVKYDPEIASQASKGSRCIINKNLKFKGGKLESNCNYNFSTKVPPRLSLNQKSLSLPKIKKQIFSFISPQIEKSASIQYNAAIEKKQRFDKAVAQLSKYIGLIKYNDLNLMIFEERPSIQIINIMRVFCILNGHRSETWRQIRSILQPQAFFQSLSTLKIMCIPNENIKLAEEIIDQNEITTSSAKCLSYLCHWIFHIIKSIINIWHGITYSGFIFDSSLTTKKRVEYSLPRIKEAIPSLDSRHRRLSIAGDKLVLESPIRKSKYKMKDRNKSQIIMVSQ